MERSKYKTGVCEVQVGSAFEQANLQSLRYESHSFYVVKDGIEMPKCFVLTDRVLRSAEGESVSRAFFPELFAASFYSEEDLPIWQLQDH
jgi:hypothetical protein